MNCRGTTPTAATTTNMRTMTEGKQNKRLLWLLLLGVGVFNVADYFLTLYAVKQGFREANPFMDTILHTVWFPKVKLLVVPLLLLLIWLRRKQLGSRLYFYVWLIFIVYASLMVYYAYLFWSGRL